MTQQRKQEKFVSHHERPAAAAVSSYASQSTPADISITNYWYERLHSVERKHITWPH